MKRTLFNLSVILIILPVSLGSSDNAGCNKAKHTSDKETEIKQKNPEELSKESKFEDLKKCTFHLS